MKILAVNGLGEEKKKSKKEIESIGWVKNALLKSSLLRAGSKSQLSLAVPCPALQPGAHFGHS